MRAMQAYQKHPGGKTNTKAWKCNQVDGWLKHSYHQNPAGFLATKNTVLGRRLLVDDCSTSSPP